MQNPMDYQSRIIQFYTNRVDYDSDHTRDRALRHLAHAPAEVGQHVLDVATGTGFVAIGASEMVGPTGSVIGIDITSSYLKKAQAKIDDAAIQNIQLIEIDEAKFTATEASFDRIYCSSAIVLFPDIPATLKRWHDWLKPGGKVCFCASTETSFFSHTIVAACRSQGIDLPNLHIPLGSIARCETLLQNAGFQNVAIQPVDFGKWMTLAEAQAMWNGRFWFHSDDPLPHQSEDTLSAIKTEYDRQIKTLEKPQGVWFENITYYVSADR